MEKVFLVLGVVKSKRLADKYMCNNEIKRVSKSSFYFYFNTKSVDFDFSNSSILPTLLYFRGEFLECIFLCLLRKY